MTYAHARPGAVSRERHPHARLEKLKLACGMQGERVHPAFLKSLGGKNLGPSSRGSRSQKI